MSDAQTVLFPDLNDNGILDTFGTGGVTSGGGIQTTSPTTISSPGSPWLLAQWGQPQPLVPDDYVQNNPATFDPLYGNALYSWSEPSTNEAFAIYANAEGNYVYDLTDGNGLNEADEFISSPAAINKADNSLDHPITLSMDAKISQIMLQEAASSTSSALGVLRGNIDIGMTINFNGADGLPRYSGFVQIIPMTTTVAFNQFKNAYEYESSYATFPLSSDPPTASQFIFSDLISGDQYLPLIASDANAQPDMLTYSINRYVYAALVDVFSNFQTDQRAALLDLSNWSLGSVYIGLATSNQQTGTDVGGNVSLSLQVSNLAITSDLSQTYDSSKSVVPTPNADNNPQISFYDSTARIGGEVDGSAVAGGYGVQARYLYVGSDSVSLSAPVGQNWLFGGGSGQDGLTASSGKNVFVASSGSSFMIGGSGNDQFMIPDATETGTSTWDSIENFHSGDLVSLSGLAGPDWSYTWIPSAGASGATGLTLFAQNSANPGLSELVTLVGLSTADSNTLLVRPGTGTNTNDLTIENNSGLYQIQAFDSETGQETLRTGVTTDDTTSVNASYIYAGSDNMSFLAPEGEDWTFGGGTGQTALVATSGNNTFIASTGSSFMIGGSGNDTFDIPDANLTGKVAWDTIVNFHSGDDAMLAGVAGPGWTYSWLSDAGAAGSAGLTLLVQSTEHQGLSELVTFSGLNLNDELSLKLTESSSGTPGILVVTHT